MILLVNGSPRNDGVTNHALDIFKDKLGDCIKLQVPPTFSPCINCRQCKVNHTFCDEFVDEFVNLAKDCDGVVMGSPVYYGGITSQMKSFLTKLFYSSPKCLELKPIVTFVSSRRCGSLLALSEFNAPFLMHSGILIGSTYWNEVYGDNPQEMDLDYEGIQTIENCCDNLKFVVESLKGKDKPIHNNIRHLNFISREYQNLLKEK